MLILHQIEPILKDFNNIVTEEIKTIEVLDGEQKLQRVVFAAHSDSRFLDSKSKETFLTEVKR